MNFSVKGRHFFSGRRGARRALAVFFLAALAFLSVRLYDRLLTDAVYEPVVAGARETVHSAVLDALGKAMRAEEMRVSAGAREDVGVWEDAGLRGNAGLWEVGLRGDAGAREKMRDGDSGSSYTSAWDGLITFSSGGYFSLDADAACAIETAVTAEVSRILDERSSVSVSVPLGSLTKSKFLSDKGPPVKASVHLVSAVTSSVSSSVEKIGVNGSLYKVILTVRTDCTLLFPSGPVDVSFSDPLILGERLIPGDVPLT